MLLANKLMMMMMIGAFGYIDIYSRSCYVMLTRGVAAGAGPRRGGGEA